MAKPLPDVERIEQGSLTIVAMDQKVDAEGVEMIVRDRERSISSIEKVSERVASRPAKKISAAGKGADPQLCKC